MTHLTVKQLIKQLQKCPQNAKVYRADHDHSLYETAGTIGAVTTLNQQREKDKWHLDNLDKIFHIKGTYVCLSP